MRCGSRSLAAVILFVASVSVLEGCRTSSSIPSCPVPSVSQIDSVSEMIDSGEYPDVELWIAELERFCGAIERM